MSMIMIGYKLFRVKKNRPGELFPLYVLADEPVPIGVWTDAIEGPRTETGKVKSRIGPLAFRPGWHLSDIPLAIHIGIKENGKIKYMHDDEVWCECVYVDCYDYQEEADKNGWVNGRFDEKKAMLLEKGVDWNALGEGLRYGSFFRRELYEKVLSEDEVAKLPERARTPGLDGKMRVTRSRIAKFLFGMPPWEVANKADAFFHGAKPVAKGQQ